MTSYPIVSFARQSLPAGQVPAAATAGTASLGSGPSGLPAPSMKLTSTLIAKPTSADDTV